MIDILNQYKLWLSHDIKQQIKFLRWEQGQKISDFCAFVYRLSVEQVVRKQPVRMWV